MASRPILKPYQLVTNQSMTSTFTSNPTNIEQLSLLSYDISWTGTPNGTFSVQVSNTYVPAASSPGNLPVNAGNWTTLTLSTLPTATGAPGNGGIDIAATGFTWCRLVYTPSSSTGTLSVTVSGKVL
jgi:hypothetical protein